ncbi:hypothetical protein ACZ90_69655 [Streptomyces albus subsp. albus]|nr:hypothetical protein ACZ90_69655 [Streptomyces albus subsp. albus]
MTHPHEDPRILAFVYDRDATGNQAALQARLDRCREYAAARGWTVAGEWIDRGDAALMASRPALRYLAATVQEQLSEARRGDSRWRGVCLVADWGRISHDANVSAVLRRRIRSAGGHCVTTEGETDAPHQIPPVTGDTGAPNRPATPAAAETGRAAVAADTAVTP